MYVSVCVCVCLCVYVCAYARVYVYTRVHVYVCVLECMQKEKKERVDVYLVQTRGGTIVYAYICMCVRLGMFTCVRSYVAKNELKRTSRSHKPNTGAKDKRLKHTSTHVYTHTNRCLFVRTRRG